MTVSRKKNDIPHWLNMALRGVVCWIGWRRSFYRMHNLVEGAIVAETCNVIAANLGDNQKLICEKLYKDIDSNFPIGQSKRADLAIVQKDGKNPKVTHVIEVKRDSSSELMTDIERLGVLKLLQPQIKTYLIVFAENERPKAFVTENGCAVKKKLEYKATQKKYSFKVRKVVKMSHAFSKKEHAHYACVLEVL
jgi:hypothetical protein